MSYIFKGRLCSYICSECREPLRRAKVRLYNLDAKENPIDRAVASAKDTFTILDDKAIKAKESLLIAEVETDADGNYSFELGDEQKYRGDAFEVDVYVDSSGDQERHKDSKPVQFTLTVLKPQWRYINDVLTWGWDYCLPYRWWCRILACLGLWVICGKVVLCKDRKKAMPGVKVTAFDSDLWQHDTLGSAITDSSGGFHIYYTTAKFQPGAWWNIELIGGPDLYFMVESSIGTPLLVEPPIRGRASDRENVGHCFCVTLCVEDVDPPKPPEAAPFFSKLGDYNYTAEVNSTPAGNGLTKIDNRAFFSTVKLNGILPKTQNGNQIEYRFEVQPLNAAGVSTGPWAKVGIGQIAKTLIGSLEHANPDPTDPNPIETLDYFVDPSNTEPLRANIFTDADGDWIQVPQQSSSATGNPGFFTPNNDMIQLITTSFAPSNVVDLAAPDLLQAGNSVTSVPAGNPLVQNKYFAIKMLFREHVGGGSGTQAGICQKVAIENTVYTTLNHPSWMALPHTQIHGVGMVDIAQLIAAGCSGITDQLDVVITTAHPNLGGVGLEMTGPGGPYSFTLPAAVPGERFGTATTNFVVADLKKCAYIVTLTAEILLTNGKKGGGEAGSIIDQIAFCKADPIV